MWLYKIIGPFELQALIVFLLSAGELTLAIIIQINIMNRAKI